MTFLMHCGAREVKRHDLWAVPVPEAAGRFMPVPHDVLADGVEQQLLSQGFEITNERHALNKDGAQYFGYFEVAPRITDLFVGEKKDYSVVIGFRSSYNKSLAVKMAMGSHVMICDNLSLNGDITVFHKHTTNVLEQLADRLAAGVAQLHGFIANQDAEFNVWRETLLDTTSKRDNVIGELYRSGVVPKSKVTDLFDEFRNQTFDHGTPTLWRMFNATTQVLKSPSDTNLVALPRRTQNLHRVLNQFIGTDDYDSFAPAIVDNYGDMQLAA